MMRQTNTAVLLGMLALVVATAVAPASAQNPMKIGFMAPLTGGAAQIGKDMVDGFKMYLDEAATRSPAARWS